MVQVKVHFPATFNFPLVALFAIQGAGCFGMDASHQQATTRPTSTAAAAISIAPAASSDPDRVVKLFQAYCNQHDVDLELDDRRPGYWRIACDHEGFDLSIVFRVFPPGTSVADMQRSLLGVSLPYHFNEQTGLAMSDFELRADPFLPADAWDKASHTRAKLQGLFDQFRLP